MPSTIRGIITRAAEAWPDATAVLAPGCDSLSYRHLDRTIARVGDALARSGIGRGDTVGLVCSNGPTMATAFLSIASRAACAPLNPGYRSSEFEFYLADLQPRAMVIEAGLDSAVREVATARGIAVFELAPARGIAVFELAPARGIAVFELAPAPSASAGDIDIAGPVAGPIGDASLPEEQDVALLLHTSGTTSRPKLVPLTHANLCASARHIAESLGLLPDDRCLNVMPLFHVHGLMAAVLASWSAGASVVCCPGFVAPRFFEWVAAFRPTWYTAVPTIHQAVLARAASHRDLLTRHRFRFIRSCSSALAPSLMKEMESAFQAPVVEAYGMTEAAHQMASNRLPPGTRKPGSVGVAAGPEVAVMDDAGHLVPRGDEGEIVIRGPNVTPGYAANPEANRSAFTDGWFRTGDQGYLDQDGYVFLSGRRKEIINRGGEKIAPREVDEVLLAHPDVGQAVAFAVPDARLGETVAAAVVLKPGRAVEARDLRAFSAQRLADFKVPERIVFVDEIPKGPSGKVQRLGLAASLGADVVRPAAVAPPPFVAPRSRIEKEVAAAFAETLRTERAGLRDHFFDRGGDSLLAAAMLARVTAVTGVELPMLAFLEDPTVGGACASIARLARDPGTAGDRLRYVVRSAPGRPLFCFPGSSNDIVGFFHLARRLGDDQAVTAFRFPAGIPSIQALASRYVEEMLAAQPEGACRLAGMCAGGFVAYEVARQLSARGRTVELLAILDCYNHDWGARLTRRARAGYRLDLLRRRVAYQWNVLGTAGPGGAAARLRGKLRAFSETARQRWHERASGWLRRSGLRSGMSFDDPTTAIRRAAARYAPAPFDGRLDLFRAEEPRVDGYAYPEMGWQGLARHGTVLHDVPGGHRTLLADPSLQVIADRLLERLEPRAGDLSDPVRPG